MGAKCFGPREIAADPNPLSFGYSMDSARYTRAAKKWHWQIETPLKSILEETAEHTAKHPDWLELAAPTTAFAPQRSFLSVVILSRDEQQCVASSIEHLSVELRLHNVPHEIIVVDDGSRLCWRCFWVDTYLPL
jgi:hypothetical protein